MTCNRKVRDLAALRIYLASGLMAAASLLNCSRPAEQAKKNPVSEPRVTNMTARHLYCGGRFSFLTPYEMTETGRGQSMYHTNIATVPLPAAGMDGYWSAKAAGSGSGRRMVELEPGVKGAWSSNNTAFPDSLTLEVVKAAGRVLLVVNREGVKGKENLAETLVKNILDSYVPSTDVGFCIGDGAITLMPSVNEAARLLLQEPATPEVTIRLETQTVREPDLTTYSTLDEEKALAASMGGTVDVLRQQERTAAGLRGKEAWIAFVGLSNKAANQPGIRFTWHYPGEAASSTKPSINIVASAPTDRRTQLEGIWESVLSSLQAIPLAGAK